MYLKCTKELAHQEMIAAIVYQLTRNLTPEQIREGGFDAYFVDHTTGIYPQSAAGMPFSTGTSSVQATHLPTCSRTLLPNKGTHHL